MTLYHVRINGKDRTSMADLVREYDIAVFRHTYAEVGDSEFRVDAYAEEEQITQLEEVGYKIERLADVEEVGKARQTEVGKGDEYRRYQQSQEKDAPD